MSDRTQETLKKVGTVLKQIRKDKKLTQNDIAEKIGVERPYISIIERGERINVSFGKIIKYIDALEIGLYEFAKLADLKFESTIKNSEITLPTGKN